MGQITNVISLHLMQNKNTNSLWYSDYNNYPYIFKEDFVIYLYLRSKSNIKFNVLKRKHIYQIELVRFCIYRTTKTIILNLYLMYLKRRNLKKTDLTIFVKDLLVKLKRLFIYKHNNFFISYKIGKNTAKFTAMRIGTMLEKRIKFRSKAVEKIINKTNFLGIRVKCKGRLNFVDRARQNQIAVGSVPLQTFGANIDYGLAIANTKKGLQSVKVWIYSLNK